MDKKNANLVIDKFRSYVIQQARSNLTKGKKNNNKSLYNSLKSVVEKDKGTGYTIVGFQMMDYGQFVDQGVKGAFPNLVKNGVQKAPNSPFKFKNKRPPVRDLITWAKERGIKLRDKDGRFAKGGYATLGFLLSRSIYAQGIKPTLFFTKPFEAALKKFITTDLLNALGEDVDTIVDYNIKKIK